MSDLIISRKPPVQPLSEAAAMLEESSARVDAAFKALAARDIIGIQHQVLEALAVEVTYVTESRPELNELEAMRTARALLQQRLRCYLGALEQLQ